MIRWLGLDSSRSSACRPEARGCSRAYTGCANSGSGGAGSLNRGCGGRDARDRTDVALQATGQGHDALDPRMSLLQVQACLLLCFLPSCLARRPRFQLAGDALEIVGHFRVRLEEEELQVPGFVLQLDLRPVLQDVRDCPIWPIQ